MTPFEQCLAVFWLPQNDGQPLHDTEADPGGATSWGVTFSTYAGWQTQHGLPYPSVADLAAATQDDLAPILQAWFWKPVGCDGLPVPVALMVFEACGMSGPGVAARVLQRAVGAAVDGDVGPRTLAAANAMGAAELIATLTATYEAYVNGLPTAPRFARGWDRRILADRATALGWLMGSAG